MKISPVTHLSRLPVCASATAHSPALPTAGRPTPPASPAPLPCGSAWPAASSWQPHAPARARHSAPPPRLRQIPHRHIPVPAVRRAGRGAPTPASTAGSSAAGYAGRRSGRPPVPWWPLSVLEAHALPVCLSAW